MTVTVGADRRPADVWVFQSQAEFDLLGPNGDGVRGQVLAGSLASAVAA